jgi:hypothetical protein
MKTENDAPARQGRQARQQWLGDFGGEWLLQLALFCAVVTAMAQGVASLAIGSIA